MKGNVYLDFVLLEQHCKKLQRIIIIIRSRLICERKDYLSNNPKKVDIITPSHDIPFPKRMHDDVK